MRWARATLWSRPPGPHRPRADQCPAEHRRQRARYRHKARRQALTAGVENPWGDDPAYIQAVELADGDSLVISGDYQRYFEYDGVRYAHLIDLTTGYPARYVSSVAVLARADTGGLADALSTGLFCLPEETGQALAAQNHYAVLWMRPDETTSQSADCTIKTTPIA